MRISLPSSLILGPTLRNPHSQHGEFFNSVSSSQVPRNHHTPPNTKQTQKSKILRKDMNSYTTIYPFSKPFNPHKPNNSYQASPKFRTNPKLSPWVALLFCLITKCNTSKSSKKYFPFNYDI
jgi:hypothetical protein